MNYTESDRQTLALCNRANWEISEETEDGIEELNTCAEEEARLVDQLIAFCIDNWDSEFMHEIQAQISQVVRDN